VLRWEIPSGKALPPLAGAAPVTTIAFRPGAGAVLAVGAVDGSIRLRDLADGAALAELPGAVLSDAQGQPLEPRALAFSADGGRLACALADGTLRLWAGTSGDAGATRRSAAIGDPGKPLTAIAFDPTGGPTLLAASADGSLRFWSTSDAGRGEPSARELARIDAGAGPVAALALDATASTLACVGVDGRVALLRTETPLAVARARESLAQAVEARRAGVQDWYSGGGARGALAEFERTRAGLDPSQVHAVRDLLLRFGPSAPR
jgi:WD40 repeat protein